MAGARSSWSDSGQNRTVKTSTTDCFALLDDRQANPGQPTSRLYRGFVREHHCTDPAGLSAMWAPVDADLRAGLHAVLLIDYEWGAKLLKAGQRIYEVPISYTGREIAEGKKITWRDGIGALRTLVKYRFVD